jgi:serine/threonine protein kinase
VVSGDNHGADVSFVDSFPAGSRVAGYRLEERIGQGGMAVVFRARDERLGRMVTLNVAVPITQRP